MPEDLHKPNLPIDTERMWTDLMTLGVMTEPDRPYTRRAFSPLFLEGRAFLTERMKAAGLTVRVDTAGNLIGRLEGTEPGLKAIATGSHSDTVQAGGRFDGIAGVIAGLEAARAIAESGKPLRHPLEVIDFLAEEPSDFGLSCIGSRGIVGMLDDKMLAMSDPKGAVLSDALREVGGDPDRPDGAIRTDLAAFVEMHIEQGPVLEAAKIDIGVVTSIVGIRRVEIVFEGEAAHAGTAPMHLRKDAGYAGAATLVAIRELAERLAQEGPEYFVATVGIFDVKPGGSNVVPGRCRMVIDARSSSRAMNDRFVAAIDKASAEAATTARARRTTYETLSDGLPAICDEGVKDAIRGASARFGYSTVEISSGAGHDAAFMAKACPMGMIFIPCLRGMSHHPDEWSEKEEVAAGTAVLLEAIRTLDATL
jgi:N-carbamoyl-L-amino-acid hydrolase